MSPASNGFFGSPQEFGQAGAFLFGDFSAVDSMFAPVVHRLHIYKVAVTPGTRVYMDAMAALPARQHWSTQDLGHRQIRNRL